MVFFGLGADLSFGAGLVTFGPKETSIKGSIKYSVIGRYNAQFSSFRGKVAVDEAAHTIRSVYLEIDAASIASDCQWCDKIVRSRQLLDTGKHPRVIFTSDEIVKNGLDYTVKGSLELHGVKRQVSFPFHARILEGADPQQKILDIKGDWQISRKDFKIIWNPILDQGGILVGNYISVDWGIRAGIK